MRLVYRPVFAIGGLALFAACGPKVRPDLPDETRTSVAPPVKHPPTSAPAHDLLVGEMCPQGAAGGPAVAPLLVHGVGWSSEADDVGDALASAVYTFAVLDFDGSRAGVFEVLGAADVGLDTDVAVGSYTGRSPCQPASADGLAKEDVECTKATGGCAVAVASIDPAARDEGAPDVATGTACAAGDALMVDVDGDGAAESFPIAQFIDGVRAPAEEILAQPVAGASCDQRHALYGLTIVPEADDPKAPDDPRYHVVIDILAIADLDNDGRRELVVQFRYPESRTFAIYSAKEQAGRLELVGEAVPWQ